MNGVEFRTHQTQALEVMDAHKKALIIAPTSAGKSFIIFGDIHKRMQSQENALFVIVSSRILLLQQLSNEFSKVINNANIVHMHSGETGKRKITDFLQLAYWADKTQGPKVIFVTYHSLHKIAKAELNIDSIYLDEAHNGAKKHFFESVKDTEKFCEHLYSFTATPRYHKDPTKNGNNNADVYGDQVYSVNAVQLINDGSILPPKTTPIHIPEIRDKKEGAHERDYYTLMDCILNGDNTDRVLITCPSTKAMMALLSMTDFIKDLSENGYDIFHITSKYGAFHNNDKLKRTEFLKRIEDYGKENRKFVVMHYSILNEGWSNNSIQSSIFMRQQSIGATVQNVGRTLRLGHTDIERIRSGSLTPGDYENYEKPFGEIIIPVYRNHGSKIEEQVDSIVTEVFINGNYVYDTIDEPKVKAAA
jgi:superfamily II DNA or RNA helicase